MGKSSKRRKATKLGYCNLCNLFKDLTFDHVPPKGSVEISPVEMRYIIDKISEVANHPAKGVWEMCQLDEKYRVPISQNGIKFRTICASCNNTLLGGRYDPEISRLSTDFGRLVRARFEAGLMLPSVVSVSVRSHNLMRGIIGHLLAATKSKDQTKPLPGFEKGFYRHLRDYFLNEDLPLPPEIEIYIWPYPSKDQIIVKGLTLWLRDNGDKFIQGDLIKFFPLAYYITDKENATLRLNTPSIIGDGCNDKDCVILLQMSLDTCPPVDWPEVPSEVHSTMMPFELSVFAKHQKRKRP